MTIYQYSQGLELLGSPRISSLCFSQCFHGVQNRNIAAHDMRDVMNQLSQKLDLFMLVLDSINQMQHKESEMLAKWTHHGALRRHLEKASVVNCLEESAKHEGLLHAQLIQYLWVLSGKDKLEQALFHRGNVVLEASMQQQYPPRRIQEIRLDQRLESGQHGVHKMNHTFMHNVVEQEPVIPVLGIGL